MRIFLNVHNEMEKLKRSCSKLLVLEEEQQRVVMRMKGDIVVNN